MEGVWIWSGSSSPAGTTCDASATVTFAALKPGLLQGEGPSHSGRVRVADIGIGFPLPRALLVEDDIEVHLHAWRGRLWVRISAQIYNERSDIARLGDAVARRES